MPRVIITTHTLQYLTELLRGPNILAITQQNEYFLTFTWNWRQPFPRSTHLTEAVREINNISTFPAQLASDQYQGTYIQDFFVCFRWCGLPQNLDGHWDLHILSLWNPEALCGHKFVIWWAEITPESSSRHEKNFCISLQVLYIPHMYSPTIKNITHTTTKTL